MKMKHSIVLALLAIGLLNGAFLLSSQAAGPPAYVDYQGKVFDSSTGAPLGSAGSAPNYTSNPTNYVMHFKVFSSLTGGDPVWAEMQTVTVDLGNFAIRLGAGAAIPGLNPAPAVGSIKDAFGGSERYLELTVFEDGQPGAVISPRLAFQTSPFCFVAARAQAVDGGIFTGTIDASSGTFTGGVFNDAVFGGTKTIFNQPVGIGLNDPVTQFQIMGGADASLSNHGYMMLGEVGGANLVLDNNEILARQNGGVSDMMLQKEGGNLIIGTDGNTNVGIGDSSPDSKLQIRGGEVAGLTTNGFMVLGSTDSGGRSMTLDFDTIVARIGNQSAGLYLQRPGGDVVMCQNGGRVGIGSANTPVTQLEIRGGVDASLTDHGYMVIGDVSGRNLVFDSNEIQSRENGAAAALNLQIEGGDLLICKKGGNVGIGTDSPQAKLHVNGYKPLTFYREAWLNKDGVYTSNGTKNNYSMSIKASDRILADAFDVSSDARIKDIEGVSDMKKDLSVLQGIEITDYHFKDYVSKGKGHYKKVIAQQVEKVFPIAISQQTGVVPDIYKMATSKEGWVMLKTNLKVGEKVRLIVGGKQAALYDVAEVSSDRFRVAKPVADGDVFVYGRQVDDFRVVDYDAIAMLNVSATQQLKKEKDAEVLALREEIRSLKARLGQQSKQISTMKARGEMRDQKLQAIEAWMALSQSPKMRDERNDNAQPVVQAVHSSQ